MRTIAAATLIFLAATPATAQFNGHVSVMFDTLPDLDEADGAQSVSELRVRVFAERHDEFGPHLRVTLSGYVDGLIADRGSIFRLKAEATGAEGTGAQSSADPIFLNCAPPLQQPASRWAVATKRLLHTATRLL